MQQTKVSTLAVPPQVQQVLAETIDAAHAVFGDQLRAVVLFGSAAEGRLRSTSDVNLILVVSAFDPSRAAALRGPLQLGEAAIRLRVMFLLEHEIPAALEAFPVKFADVLRRRVVLYGSDVFASLTVPRPLTIARLKQVSLNHALRLRAQYVARSGGEDQLALLVADAAGPLRSCAATLCMLEGRSVGSGREALQQLVKDFPDDGWADVLENMSVARERRFLPVGSAASTAERIIELAQRLAARAAALKP